MSRGSKLSTIALAAHAEGEGTPSERAEIDANLADDPEARARLAQVHSVRAALRAPLPELDDVDLRGRIGVALQERARGTTRSSASTALWASGVAAAACMGWFLAQPSIPSSSDEFQARGLASSEAEAAAQWAGVRVYRAVGVAEVAPLGESATLSRGDRLLFSYQNLGPRPFTHLMIFAVDARDEVRWYYPAFTVEGTDPSSIAIAGHGGEVLPDLIAHDYALGPLEVYALFSRRPLSVSEVEDVLKRSRAALSDVPGTFVQQIDIEVKR